MAVVRAHGQKQGLGLHQAITGHMQAKTGCGFDDRLDHALNAGRVEAAGVADHLHIHVVPRWNGDTNFMPVLANTSVLPQALNEVAAKLRAALAK